MPKFTDGISIPRRLVRVGTLTKDATFCTTVSGDNEIDELPFQVQKLHNSRNKQGRGIIFGVNQDNIGIDLLNASAGLEYPIMGITLDLCEKQIEYGGFTITDNYFLDSLLDFLGFEDDVTTYELVKIWNILIRKRKIKKLVEQGVLSSDMFELLIKNQKLGYSVTDSSEYYISQKRFAKSRKYNPNCND